MKIMLTTFLVALVVCSGAASQPHVVADTVDGWVVCGGYPIGTQCTQIISIANPNAVQRQVKIVFSMYASIAPLIAPPYVVYYNGIDTLFDSSITVSYSYLQEGNAWLTAISLSASASGTGLPISGDTIPYLGLFFEAGPYEYDSLCFDSTTSDSLGGWFFDPGPNPTWSGEECYLITRSVPDGCYAVITNCPFLTPLSNSYFCEPIAYDFEADWGLGLGPPVYEIMGGPGEIGFLTGEWSFSPTAADAGLSFMLYVHAGEDWCGDGSSYRWNEFDSCIVQIDVAPNNPPSFVIGQQNIFVATTAETLTVTQEVADADPCTDYRFSFYTLPEDPDPPGYFDTLTGDLHYFGEQADTGIYHIFPVITEGEFVDTTEYYIYHYESYTCGDIDHSGSINVADLTWLVDFLFNGGSPPVTYEAGDIDCHEGINVVDITYLVDFFFFGGPPPCDGCP
jgi:hypothetical protein